MTDKSTGAHNDTNARFTVTHWSIILPAAAQEEPGAREAMELLCKIYRPPVYAFLRKQWVRSREDAEDLVQGFFFHILSKERLRKVHPTKGKFRNWLMACLRYYLINEWKKGEKRGHGKHDPLGPSGPEETGGWEPAGGDDPVKEFERQWASALIWQVLQQLKEQCTADDKAELFEVLHPFLTDAAERGDYAIAAEKLKLNQGAVRTAATRLRQDYRKLLRIEVGRTVSDPAEIDDEIQYLFSLFARD